MADRPLSPHLQIYRWRMNMLMSILHRASGVALVFGTLVVIWMLVAAAMGPAAFDQFARCIGSVPGQVMLFGWTVALFYHMANGVRHLVWDIGIGFDPKVARLSGWAVWIVMAVLTGWVWCTHLFG